MEFTVPQFIEYEAKVIGPFTFKQFIIVGVAGIACFVIYLKSPSLLISIPLIAIIGGAALGVVFFKFQGRSPVVMLKNFTFFSVSPKVYLWKRKLITPKVIKKTEAKKPVEEEPTLKVIKKSRLRDLAIKLETRKK